MKVEVLYFDGCPNHEALLPHLRELLRAAGAGTDIELVRVEDADAAERERFLAQIPAPPSPLPGMSLDVFGTAPKELERVVS